MSWRRLWNVISWWSPTESESKKFYKCSYACAQITLLFLSPDKLFFWGSFKFLCVGMMIRSICPWSRLSSLDRSLPLVVLLFLSSSLGSHCQCKFPNSSSHVSHSYSLLLTESMTLRFGLDVDDGLIYTADFNKKTCTFWFVHYEKFFIAIYIFW